jgi:hypothetical protein
VTKLDSTMEGRIPVELAYLTGGLGWSADTSPSSPDESTIELKGWVTLTNTSGTSYRNAKLQLVAGNLNQVRQAMDMQMKVATMAAAAPAQPMTEQAMFEYHLYTLDRPTSIEENQTKQVELLTGHGVPVQKEYRFDNVVNSFNARYGEGERVNADVRLMFQNTEAAKLGLPLPKGIVRVYKADANGNAIFVGEDAIDHTPKNER